VRFIDISTLRELAARSWVRRSLLALPVLALMTLFIVTELRGVDFGSQWDEKDWHVEPARKMVKTGVFLPHQYIYPTFSKWLMLLPALPAGLAAALNSGSDPELIRGAMTQALAGPEYVLTARGIFIVVSGLAILWVYLAALALRRPWWEAFIAAAGLALSWEYAYQARYLANDCLLAQFAALTLLLLAVFHRTRRTRWLYGAALAAGLATSTKYPGVLLLLPIALTSWFAQASRPADDRLLRVVALCAMAFGAYLVTTPGTVLEPYVFLSDARRVTYLYATGHFGYTVSGPARHWQLALEYLGLCFFSPSKVVAALMAAGAIWGAVGWWRHDRRFGAVLILFPGVFLAFFCMSYRVVVVRNYLLLGPFGALLAARGIADVTGRLRSRWLRAPLLAAFAAVAIWQAAFLIRAGERIRWPDSQRDTREALAYVAQHPNHTFRVSGLVRAIAAAQRLVMPANVTQGPADSVVFFCEAEGPGPYSWKTNDPWLTEAVFGPMEVNINWYSSWQGGRDRILVMTTEKARGTEVKLAE